MPQASPLSRKTMTRDPVFGFGRSREILCVASERTPGRRSRGVPHLPARLASPWRRGWWPPRRPPPRSPPLRPRTPGRWSRATTTTARTWRGASGEKRTIRPRTNPTPASAAPSRRLRVRPTRARAARARARRCVGCVRRWSRKGRAKKSELRVLLKEKKKREPARARLERLRVRSSARRYRDLGLCERECAALAIATELVFSESSRGRASPTLDGVFSPRTVDAESAGSATCANDEPKETPKKKKKNLLRCFRCFPFPRVSCFDARHGSRRSRRSRSSENAFASRSLPGRRRPRRALPRSKMSKVKRGSGGNRSRRTVVREKTARVRLAGSERSEGSRGFETASACPSFEASWRSPSSPRSRSPRRRAPAWDAPRGASPRARPPPPPPPPRDPPRGSRRDSRDSPRDASGEGDATVPTLDRERLRRSWCDDALFAPIVESWSRGVVESWSRVVKRVRR